MAHTTENLTTKEQRVPRGSGPPIFTVTTIRIEKDKPRLDPEIPSFARRTVGFFHDRAQAFACLDRNVGSLIECGYYHYAVVEEIKCGLYPIPEHRRDDGSHQFWWKAIRSSGPTVENPLGDEHWERLDACPDELKRANEVYIGWREIG